MLDSTLQ